MPTYLLKMESPIENINCNEISEGLNDDVIKSLEIIDETSLSSGWAYISISIQGAFD